MGFNQDIGHLEKFNSYLVPTGTSINCGGRRSRPPQPLFLRGTLGENLDCSRCPNVLIRVEVGGFVVYLS